MEKESSLKLEFEIFWPYLSERARRIVAAARAMTLGYGGVSLMSRVTGLSRATIMKGIKEIKGGKAHLEPDKVRKPGG
ncbi:MAG: hypothetical protein LBT38_11240 [Deltaproteobacteria bacterium]|jgi:hypothetical protein|nr:hypothetical protein [Deltaproteobacteria bacterium]